MTKKPKRRTAGRRKRRQSLLDLWRWQDNYRAALTGLCAAGNINVAFDPDAFNPADALRAAREKHIADLVRYAADIADASEKVARSRGST
jgi:hypothetical protein